MHFATFAPALRIILLALFMRLATMGYLTPQGATELTKTVMDLLVVAVPGIYAIWAAWRESRVQLVARAAALPEVKDIVAAPEIARQIDDPTVRAG